MLASVYVVLEIPLDDGLAEKNVLLITYSTAQKI